MYGTWCNVQLFLRSWRSKWEIMAVNTPPPSLNFCLSSSKAKAEARWIRSCINAQTLQKPYAQHITLTICTLNKLAHTLLSGDGAYTHFIPRLGRLRDWITFTRIFPAACSGSYLGVLHVFKNGLRFPVGVLKLLKVYDPHHGQEFWPSSSYSKADIWSFGYEECSIPLLLVLLSRRVVCKRSVLDQIPILWKVKCSGEREEMDSHLENIWSFYLSTLFQLFWVEVWVLSLSLSLSLFIASALGSF